MIARMVFFWVCIFNLSSFLFPEQDFIFHKPHIILQ
jgi:hypothetical protein